MPSEFDEEIREFLIESNENLAALDQQIVELEKNPEDLALISSIFRTMHSIKGTCGFFGFDILGSITHLAESILGQLRERQRSLTPELISLILEAIDAVRILLARIEQTGAEGADETEPLRARLDEAFRARSAGDVLHDLMQLAEKKRDASAVATATREAQPEIAATTAVMTQHNEPANADATSSAPAAVGASLPPAALPPASVSPSPLKVETDRPAAEAPQQDLHVTDTTIRVDVMLLNQIMNLVGELVLTRNQLLQAANAFTPAVQQTSQRLNVVTTELQESVMKTRMQPIGVIWNKFPRVVRDLSAKCGKQIEIEMFGAETELDKSLIEAIRDPLTHIVRNSCDHGIETPAKRQSKGKAATGKLTLRAFHEAGAVNIEISDDGAGINPDRVRAKAVEKQLITPEQAASLSAADAVNLIFLPGFSTAPQITSLSGRGVGMNVVRTVIEKISGNVEVMLLPQCGTSIRIKIPLTLAIIPGLIVSSSARVKQHGEQQDRFVIPQSHLVEMTRVDLAAEPCPVERIHGATIFRHRGKLLPLVYLSRLLKRADEETKQTEINIIVLQVAGRQFGLVVDRICDTQEIVVKPLGQQLKHLVCYGGATEELSIISQRLTENSQDVATKAQDAAKISDDVSNNVSVVSASADEMLVSIREISRSSSEAARVARTAVTMASDTNDTISKLGESSQEIGKVVKVITSIAQQTNLLALNATIEAARAGEAGKGFAVVANEVKELAKETARATEEIGQKIEAIQGNTVAAIRAIGEVSGIINQVNDISGTIASAVEEQTATTNEIGQNVASAASGTQCITQNITRVAQGTEDAASSARDTQEAALGLARMAAEMQSLVARFSF